MGHRGKRRRKHPYRHAVIFGNENAGLNISLLRAEAILHTCESGSDLGWAVKMMAPRIIAHNVASAKELDTETLEDRLQAERKNSAGPFLRDMACGICAELPQTGSVPN
jgi:hypothetical protein